jgi:hypothetical protein
MLAGEDRRVVDVRGALRLHGSRHRKEPSCEDQADQDDDEQMHGADARSRGCPRHQCHCRPRSGAGRKREPGDPIICGTPDGATLTFGLGGSSYTGS